MSSTSYSKKEPTAKNKDMIPSKAQKLLGIIDHPPEASQPKKGTKKVVSRINVQVGDQTLMLGLKNGSVTEMTPANFNLKHSPGHHSSKILEGITEDKNSSSKTLQVGSKPPMIRQKSCSKIPVKSSRTSIKSDDIPQLEHEGNSENSRKLNRNKSISLEHIGQEDTLTKKALRSLKKCDNSKKSAPEKDSIAPETNELSSKLAKWRISADQSKPVFSGSNMITESTKIPKVPWNKKSFMRKSTQKKSSDKKLAKKPPPSPKCPPKKIFDPPLPEKPIRFKKKQLERLLNGDINPNDKPIDKNEIKALLIAICNAAKIDTITEDETMYDDPRALRRKSKAEKILGI